MKTKAKKFWKVKRVIVSITEEFALVQAHSRKEAKEQASFERAHNFKGSNRIRLSAKREK